MGSWSPRKIDYCCRNFHKGCKGEEPASPPPRWHCALWFSCGALLASRLSFIFSPVGELMCAEGGREGWSPVPSMARLGFTVRACVAGGKGTPATARDSPHVFALRVAEQHKSLAERPVAVSS